MRPLLSAPLEDMVTWRLCQTSNRFVHRSMCRVRRVSGPGPGSAEASLDHGKTSWWKGLKRISIKAAKDPKQLLHLRLSFGLVLAAVALAGRSHFSRETQLTVTRPWCPQLLPWGNAKAKSTGIRCCGSQLLRYPLKLSTKGGIRRFCPEDNCWQWPVVEPMPPGVALQATKQTTAEPTEKKEEKQELAKSEAKSFASPWPEHQRGQMWSLAIRLGRKPS